MKRPLFWLQDLVSTKIPTEQNLSACKTGHRCVSALAPKLLQQKEKGRLKGLYKKDKCRTEIQSNIRTVTPQFLL